MRFRKDTRASSDIPTSTFADIAFLLIIYFMVTVTFTATRGLDYALPKDEPITVIDPQESILVEILASGSLRVDGRNMAVAALLPYLAPRLRQNPDKPVILRPHASASYGAMVAAFDILRGAHDELGLEREVTIALPTEREIARFWR